MRIKFGLRNFNRADSELEAPVVHRKGLLTYKLTILITTMIIFSILPIIWFRYLPLIDYSNHLATIQIRSTLSSNVYLARFYEFRWLFTPYLGFDLLMTPLVSLFPVEIAGRIVIALTCIIIYIGTIALDRELNPNNWGLSIFSGIFLYNGAFNWGFINYIIGFGFAILAFWIWVRYREKINGLSIVLFTALSGITCMMHFYGFAIYGICVAGYECSVLWEKVRDERRLRMSLFAIPVKAAVSFVVPLLAVIWLSPVSKNHGPTLWWPPGFWGSLLRWKGEGLASPIYFHYFLEKPLLLVIVGFLLWALATRTLVVNSRMMLPLAAFAVIFIVAPFELLGAFLTDYRLPSGVAFFAWASLGWGEMSRVRSDVVCLLLALCLIVRVGSVFLTWQPMQSTIEEYNTALRSIPPGSRLLVISGDSGRNTTLDHVPVLAAAKHGVFVPYTFTDDGELVDGIQLLKLTPDYRDYRRDFPIASSIRDVKRFDYLLKIRSPQLNIPSDISLREVGRGQTFTLYRIDNQPPTSDRVSQ
jgi:hypothetical protein